MRFSILCLTLCLNLLAQKYSGPKPAKPDVPYLLHASNLLELDSNEGSEEKRKDGTAFLVSGAAAKARTPMAEPIFILDSNKLTPERLQLWRMEVKNGRREVFIPTRPKRDGPHALRLTVTKLAGTLYKLEAAESLEPGQYSLSPENSNQAFCFQVY